jgi:hypothetical protein
MVNIHKNSVGKYKHNDSVELCGYVPQILHRQNSVLMYKYTVVVMCKCMNKYPPCFKRSEGKG